MVANSLIFGCPITALSSANLVVEINQSVSVRAEYSVLPTLGTFYHCLGFQQNGMFDQLIILYSYNWVLCCSL